MKNKNSRVSMSTGLFIALVLGFTSAASQAATYTIVVNFSASGCPLSVDKPILKMASGGNDKVQWDSEPNTAGYQIFFDPFKGQPITGNPQGNTSPIGLSGAAPPGVDFEYTVYNSACPESPLDPRIRVF